MCKPQIGDVYSADYGEENVALQLVSVNRVLGTIARVCKFDPSAENICKGLETLFVIGFPILAAIKDGYLSHIGRCLVPDGAQVNQLRFPNLNRHDRIVGWTILHEEGQKIVSDLTEEELAYPLAYTVNIKKLEELIARKWDGKKPVS